MNIVRIELIFSSNQGFSRGEGARGLRLFMAYNRLSRRVKFDTEKLDGAKRSVKPPSGI